jgi:hypothetical protein
MLPLFFLLLISSLVAEEVDLSDPFRPVNLVKELPGKAFLIEGLDEVDIKDDLIRRITLGSDGKTLTILFDNKTQSLYTPRLTIWIVDRYGLPVRECTEMWIIHSVSVGETRSHDARFMDSNLADVLQWTSVGAPDDAGVPKYLVVQYLD